MELSDFFLPPRTISVSLSTEPLSNGNISFSEAVLGVIPGSFANLMSLLLPNYLNDIVIEFSDTEMALRGVFVCGLVPGTTAYSSGKIFLGDYISSINATSISLELFEDSLRSTYHSGSVLIEITAQSLRIDKLAAVFGKSVTSDYVIQFGENTHWNGLCNSLSLFPFTLFCCGGQRQDDSSGKALYSHPLSEQRLQKALEGIIPCLIFLSDDYEKRSTLNGMQVRLEKELISVATSNTDPFGCVVLALPHRVADVSTCCKALQIMLRVILFYFGTFEKAFEVSSNGVTEETDRIVSVILFEILCPDLLFEELQMSTDMSWSLFQTKFVELPHLPLPETVKVTVDSVLTDFEASDFSDPFLISPRRRFVIMGSCLFYKGFMIASHLNTTDLVDIGLFLRHRFILSALSFSPQMASTLCGSLLGGPSSPELVSSPRAEQSVIWCEVFPTHRSKNINFDEEPCWPTFGYSEPAGARYILLVVPKKQTFLAVLLEASGLSSDNSTDELSPDSIIVREVSKALGKLENIGLSAFCEQGLASSLGVKLVSADIAYPSASLSITPGRRRTRTGGIALQTLAVANVQRFSNALKGFLARKPHLSMSMSFSSEQVQVNDLDQDVFENQDLETKKFNVISRLTKAFKKKFLRKGELSHASSYSEISKDKNEDFDAAHYAELRGVRPHNVDTGAVAVHGGRERAGVPGSYAGSGSLSTSEGPGRDEGIPLPLANALPTLFDMSEAHLHSGDMSSNTGHANRGAPAAGVVQDILFACPGHAFSFTYFDRNQGFYICPNDTYSPSGSSAFHRRVSNTFLRSTIDMINLFDAQDGLEEAGFLFPSDPVEWFDFDPSVFASLAMSRVNSDKDNNKCTPGTCSPKNQRLPIETPPTDLGVKFDVNPDGTPGRAYWCTLRKFPSFPETKEDRGATSSSARMFALCGDAPAVCSALDLGLQFAFDLAL